MRLYMYNIIFHYIITLSFCSEFTLHRCPSRRSADSVSSARRQWRPQRPSAAVQRRRATRGPLKGGTERSIEPPKISKKCRVNQQKCPKNEEL